MEVVIVGAGAIGLLVGSYLAESGVSVSFLTRREEQAAKLREQGVSRVVNYQERTFQVQAFSDVTLAPRKAIWILAVKSRNLQSLVGQLEGQAAPEQVLFIQNGLRHYELGLSTSVPSVAVASLTHGAVKVEDRTVKHNGIGSMNIAVLKGSLTSFAPLVVAESSSFPIRFQSDAYDMLLRKVMINCCINPLTALLELKNGELLTNKPAHQLMHVVYRELAAGYPEAAKSLPFSEVEDVCKRTAANCSSMLTDRRNHEKMEIDTIVSAILDGHEDEMPTLKVLEQLLKAIDKKEGST